MKRRNQIDKCRKIYLNDDKWIREMNKGDGKRNKKKKLLEVWMVHSYLIQTTQAGLEDRPVNKEN